jgi:hypothetical protein
MAIEATTAAAPAPAPAHSGGRGGDPIRTLIVVGGLGAGAYFGYRWWQREQVKAALLAEAERLKAQGMSTKDAITNAAAGACTAAASAAHIPNPGPLCKGAAIVAIKAAELTAKGAIIAGKAIGKGAIATGKAIGKGTKAVVYTAPKAVIGGTVNTADRLLTKAVTVAIPKPVQKLISKVVPKPVKTVAKVTKKVVKKALCLGIFCGLEGADGYEMALASAAPLARRPGGRRSPVLVPARRPPRALAGRSPVRRPNTRRPNGAGYYARLLAR